MKDIFKPKIRPFHIILNTRKTTKFGSKNLKALGPKIWNQLPTEIKSAISFLSSKTFPKSRST